MIRLLTIFAIVTLPVLGLSAAEVVPTDHPTVHIVFVYPFDNSTSAMNRVDKDGKPVQLGSIGNMVMPFDSIRPVSIVIDNNFVGHALFGQNNVSPVFSLPPGKHKFSFTCEGFRPATQDIHVLGSGSTQYLVVKMHVTDDDTLTPDVSPSVPVSKPKDSE